MKTEEAGVYVFQISICHEWKSVPGIMNSVSFLACSAHGYHGQKLSPKEECCMNGKGRHSIYNLSSNRRFYTDWSYLLK